MLHHNKVHKATSMLIMWIVMCRKIDTFNQSEMFYTKTVILRSTELTWNSPNYLTLQSEILEIATFLHKFLGRGHKSRSLKNLWQWKITFPNCRALRTSNTTWKTRQMLHRWDMWWRGCCIIHLCLQCGHITPQCLLHMWWLHREIKVMYFSQDCATRLYGSAILSLSFY